MMRKDVVVLTLLKKQIIVRIHKVYNYNPYIVCSEYRPAHYEGIVVTHFVSASPYSHISQEDVDLFDNPEFTLSQ